MAKAEHKNLFSYGDKSEVYAAFQRDIDRDTWIQMLWHMALLGCALGAAFISGHFDWLWIFGGLYATERCISRFADNSNRNWLMHAIDWYEKQQAGGNAEN
ncbi:MAG TPA: hypothetical protein VFQ97_04500 [Gallionella sp.]|nr:hypothetical protein [Gallionella sp.]